MDSESYGALSGGGGISAKRACLFPGGWLDIFSAGLFTGSAEEYQGWTGCFAEGFAAWL